MKYQLTDYEGKQTLVNKEQAQNIAEVAGLIEIEIDGQLHFINKSNIASIKPVTEPDIINTFKLDTPDYRGQFSPVKEELKKRWGKTKK
jgi:hypothetical protein